MFFGSGGLFENDPIEMSINVPFSVTLFEREGNNSSLFLMVKYLVRNHNKILKQANDLAEKGNPSLSFLLSRKASKTGNLPKKSTAPEPVFSAQSEWIVDVPFDQDKMQRVCVAVPRYSRGNELAFFFSKMEADFADKSVKKARELTLEGVEAFPYYLELFHGCHTILQNVKSTIKQEELSEVQVLTIRNNLGKMTNPHELLSLLNIILCVLKRDEKPPDTNLGEFCLRSPLISPEEAKLLQRNDFSTLQLRHVVHLYEIVEDLVAESMITEIDSRYKKELPLSFKTELDKVFTLEKDLKEHAVALKRFIFRFLATGKISEHEEIKKNIEETGCWFKQANPANQATALKEQEKKTVLGRTSEEKEKKEMEEKRPSSIPSNFPVAITTDYAEMTYLYLTQKLLPFSESKQPATPQRQQQQSHLQKNQASPGSPSANKTGSAKKSLQKSKLTNKD